MKTRTEKREREEDQSSSSSSSDSSSNSGSSDSEDEKMEVAAPKEQDQKKPDHKKRKTDGNPGSSTDQSGEKRKGTQLDWEEFAAKLKKKKEEGHVSSVEVDEEVETARPGDAT